MFNFLRNPFEQDEPDRLSPEEYQQRRTDDDVLLDVRTPEEFNEAHLEGAENINWMAADFEQQVQDLPREKTYYLYCRSGNRSGQAAERMREMGFADVYNIGGLAELARAGLPVV